MAKSSLQQRAAAYLSWAQTEDRSARTRNARNALEQKFLDEAGGDPLRAAAARKAYYAKLVQKSADARRRHTTARKAAAEARAAEVIALAASLRKSDAETAGGDSA